MSGLPAAPTMASLVTNVVPGDQLVAGSAAP